MKEVFTPQSQKYAMLCKTSDLKEVMKFLNRAVPKTAIGKLYACEITIKTNEVLFVAIGVARVLYCKTSGPVKISIPFLILLSFKIYYLLVCKTILMVLLSLIIPSSGGY